MAKRIKRAQAPKPRNVEYMKGMQELRRGNASGPHRGNEYRRKGKYGNDWE